MEPADFIKTIYLGDRGCKSIEISGWESRVTVHVTTISRIRSSTGTWDYYTDEDVVDGRLVFTAVRSVRIDPSGPLPNDFIHELRVLVADGDAVSSATDGYRFVLSIGSVDDAGRTTEVLVEIQAGGLHIEDPARPGERIVA